MTELFMHAANLLVNDERIAEAMHAYAIARLQSHGHPQEQIDSVTDEAYEDTPLARAYWDATNQFYLELLALTGREFISD